MQNSQQEVRIGVSLLAAIGLPFIVTTLYISLAETATKRNFDGEMVVFWLSLAGGFAFIAFMPVKMIWRIIGGIIYCPLMVVGLFLWVVMYVCSRFNACL